MKTAFVVLYAVTSLFIGYAGYADDERKAGNRGVTAFFVWAIFWLPLTITFLVIKNGIDD